MALSFLELTFSFLSTLFCLPHPKPRLIKNEAILHFRETSLTDEWPQEVNPALSAITPHFFFFFFFNIKYILSRTQQGVWWRDNCTALSTTSLGDGKEKQWRHSIVPESQARLTCFLKQLGFRALLGKPVLKDERTEVPGEALKFWNLQYWFQTKMGLLFEAWKGNALWPTVLSPWRGGENNSNTSSSKGSWAPSICQALC